MLRHQAKSLFAPRPWILALGFLAGASLAWATSPAMAQNQAQDPGRILPASALEFLEYNCAGCHDSGLAKGGLDLTILPFDLDDVDNAARWVRIHDRVRDGEMPPGDDNNEDFFEPGEIEEFLQAIAQPLTAADQAKAVEQGRATLRRLNREEYENTIRDLLEAPWLQIRDFLPEDGRAHHFRKVGNALDVSHVQLLQYLETAEQAIREALSVVGEPTTTKRYYARETSGFARIMPFRPVLNSAPERTTIPLLGTTAQPEVIEGKVPITVGAADPETRELEAFGVVSSTYTGIQYSWNSFHAPVSGRYRLRFKTYSFRAGPNGKQANGQAYWWKPNREHVFPSDRSEPLTIYTLNATQETRRLGAFDAHPEPEVAEIMADLVAGETIKPDASRFFRSRPGWKGNPLATEDGSPGVAYCWMEVEGPLQDDSPPAPYRRLFDDLPFEISQGSSNHSASIRLEVHTEDPEADARRLLARFLERAYRRPFDSIEIEPFLNIFEKSRDQGQTFSDAMISAYVAVLCSPGFLYLDSEPGPLDDHALAARLSYFLWNSPPDLELLALAKQGKLIEAETLRSQTDRLLDDPRSRLFVNAFLSDWLELHEIAANTPDAALYPDYYLDDLLTESSLAETQLFFEDLIQRDLPARNLIDSDHAFLNEHLQRHYGLPITVQSVEPQRVELPENSPRGGLLTQASVLKVTANGTTTSPVERGVWVMDRILGEPPPPPPPAVPAVEPDIRGSTTIREQLALHRADTSCASCHAKIDPPGFALESFDVFGGWRDRYRAIDEETDPVEGIGKNGYLFEFHHGQEVDPTGVLADGSEFQDIKEFKQVLLKDERKIARNLVRQWVVYGTGAPVAFGDRTEVEAILDRSADSEFSVRSLLHEVVQSDLFRNK